MVDPGFVELAHVHRGVVFYLFALNFGITGSSKSQESQQFRLQTARSRLYQNEIQQLKSHFAAFVKLSTIVLMSFQKISAICVYLSLNLPLLKFVYKRSLLFGLFKQFAEVSLDPVKFRRNVR